jgi:hypothetical protein
MVSVHSDADTEIIRHYGGSFIGLTDIDQEGVWTWSDGAPFDYSKWNANEPNNSGNDEDCVEINGNGAWNDLNCNSHRRALCKVN